MKRRVLHVIGNLGLGGAQSVLYHLWPALSGAHGYEFELCVLGPLGHFGERLRAEGATVHELHVAHKYDPRVVTRLRRLVRRGRFDTVHAHLFPELHVAALACAGLGGVRLVYTEHLATNRRRNWGPAARLLDAAAYFAYDRVLAVNETTRMNLVEWQPQLSNRILVVRNGVRRVEPGGHPTGEPREELARELGLEPGRTATIMLFAGRLTRQKGVDVLLESLSLLTEENFVCLIAGDGEDRRALEQTAHTYGLAGRVCFLGTRDDVGRLLRAADLLVLPSRFEGLPIIVLEAMATGCPIVATRVDGTAEALADGLSALLVEPEDADGLAAALARMIRDPTLRRRLAEGAADAAEEFSAEANARRLLRVYDELYEPDTRAQLLTERAHT